LSSEIHINMTEAIRKLIDKTYKTHKEHLLLVALIIKKYKTN